MDTQEAECGGDCGQRPNTAAGHFNICILHSADKLWIALLRIVERKEQVAVWRSSLPVIVTARLAHNHQHRLDSSAFQDFINCS